jgi:transcriptional regulator with XRE-family HTH domain
MLSISDLGSRIAARREQLSLSQSELAAKAKISRATLAALENQRIAEIGFTKLTRLLAALGLELSLHANEVRRPTLEEILSEAEEDWGRP